MSDTFTVTPRRLVQVTAGPESFRLHTDGTLFLDFGKAWFGTIIIPLPACPGRNNIAVHLGEKLGADGRIDRNPPGCIRYRRIGQAAGPEAHECRIIIPADQRNTGKAAILMPPDIGEVLPFRYAEIEDAAAIDPAAVRQVRVHYPFDNDASAFESSDQALNAVWELCRHSIKATTFCGVYVDGDRERIPYEGDAYINQLGHYCTGRGYAMARYSHEYLLQHPTWPTEWQFHSVMMAWEDYMYTGETASLKEFYAVLCTKTLIDLARTDGLISTESPACTREFEKRLNFHNDRYIFGHGLKDLVDWPPGSFTEGGQGERDGHEMLPVNTVVNAFHYRALVLMARIAAVLGKRDDEKRFTVRAVMVRKTFNRMLFDNARNVYIDGEGAEHASLHSSMFALAFGLVPPDRVPGVLAFVKSRGMACSVYGAQFLLEALYRHGEDAYALELLTAEHDRGWRHMIDAGSTVTWEAWDVKYKTNLDWNHAWGAAPANIIPRMLMGVRPLEPGFGKVLIRPQLGSLTRAHLKMPVPEGEILVSYHEDSAGQSVLEIKLPDYMTAVVDVPGADAPESVGGTHTFVWRAGTDVRQRLR